MVHSSTFDFGRYKNEIIKYHWTWIIRNKTPYIVVSGDKNVSNGIINKVASVMKKFLDELILEVNNNRFKINMNVTVAYNADEENESLIKQSYDQFNISYHKPFEEALRQYFMCLVCLENNNNRITPHLDVVITSRSLPDGFGVTYPSAIILQKNGITDKLIIHELCHALGVDRNGDDAGNCPRRDCLMHYKLPSTDICHDCKIQIISYLFERNSLRSGNHVIEEV